MSLAATIAQIAASPDTGGWWSFLWDVAQKVGSGGFVVASVIIYKLWPSYQAELAYSKDREKQTLTVLLELTTLIRGLDAHDKDAVSRHVESTKTVMDAIGKLSSLIERHLEKSK